MTDPDAEYEAIAAMLSQAGLVEQTIDAGKPAYRLTAEGKRVAEQMALSSEDDARAILDAAAGREGAVGKPYATRMPQTVPPGPIGWKWWTRYRAWNGL